MQPNQDVISEELEIDLLELAHTLLSKWYWIAIASIVCGLLGAGYNYHFVPDCYSASGSFIVTNSGNSINMSDLQLSYALTADYENIVVSNLILDQVIEQLDLDMSATQLASCISTSNPEYTRIIHVSVINEDANTAIDIVNKLIAISTVEINKILSYDEPKVLDKATMRTVVDVRTSIVKHTLVGAILGVMLSCGLIFLKIITNRTIQNEEDINKHIKVPVLGSIPLVKEINGDKNDVKWPVNLPYLMSEAFAVLRTNILYSGADVSVIGVTSANENEGKSFISFELARSLTQIGKKVLLIDGDIRKSELCTRLGFKRDIDGLSEYLSGQATIEQVLFQSKSLEGFNFIFAGRLVKSASSLMNSEKLTTLFTQLKDRYDYIIVDTPPVNVVGDAAIISLNVDGMILNIASETTKIDEAKEAKNRLEMVNANIIGVVQNKRDLTKARKYGSYGSYYYYYYGPDNKKKKRKRKAKAKN